MTRKDREREQQRRDARRSEWIHAEPEHPTPPLLTLDQIEGGNAVVILRTSRPQDSEGKLYSQGEGIKEALAAAGVTAMVFCGSDETGKALDEQNRPTLHAAIQHAKILKVPIVAACPSRFLRHPDFNIHTPDLYPTEEQWEELLELADGVPLVVCHLTASNDEDEHLLTTWSKRFKPPPKKSKEWIANKVKQLRNKGYSYRQIAERLTTRHGVPMSYGTARRIAVGK